MALEYQSHRVTATFGGTGNNATITFIEIAHGATASLDVFPAVTFDSAAPYTASSGALAVPGEVLLSVFAGSGAGGGLITVDAPWTIISQGNNPGFKTTAVATLTASTTDPVSVTWNDPEANRGYVHIMSFKPKI